MSDHTRFKHGDALSLNQKRLTAHKLLKRLETPNLGSVDTLNWGTLDVPKIGQISNPLIFEQVRL